MIRLAGGGSFQLSTTEQVYPHAKWQDGSTLYCKKVELGSLPNGSQSIVAHNITNIDLSKIYEVKAIAYNGTDTTIEVGYAPDFYLFVQTLDIVVGSSASQQTSDVYAHLVYGKT